MKLTGRKYLTPLIRRFTIGLSHFVRGEDLGFSQYTVYKNDDKLFTKGLFKCEVCGKSVVFDAKNRYYACLGKRKGTCSSGYIKEEILEADFGALLADIQRIIRRSQAVKDFKVELRRTGTALKKEWASLDRQLAKEAKPILLVEEAQRRGLRFEVEGAKQLSRMRAETQRRFEEAKELYGAINEAPRV